VYPYLEGDHKMRLLDKLVLNRLVAIVLNFIITLIKIVSPKTGEDLGNKYPLPKPPRWKPKLDRRKKNNE
jgi:hypothetical protein